MTKKRTQILIAGDLVPTQTNAKYFNEGDIKKLVDIDILNYFLDSDLSIINLECPLTNSTNRIEKQGPNLKASPESIKAIKCLNPTILSLANNHIMDFGEIGLRDTLEILENNEITPIGVGSDLEEAINSLKIITINGWKVGMYSCAEHEFSIATKNSPGANPFDPLNTGDVIYDLKKGNALDILILIYHGGKEYYQYPTPELQKTCRHLAKKGADLIVCQHSHCIGAYEQYMQSYIIYGQGNFIFDMDKPLAKDGTLILYLLEANQKPRFQIIPISKCKDDPGTIMKLQNNDAKKVINMFYERSEKVTDLSFLEEQYEIYARNQIKSYLYDISPLGKWTGRIDRKILKNKILKWLYPRSKVIKMINFIECQAHNELLRKGLSRLL